MKKVPLRFDFPKRLFLTYTTTGINFSYLDLKVLPESGRLLGSNDHNWHPNICYLFWYQSTRKGCLFVKKNYAVPFYSTPRTCSHIMSSTNHVSYQKISTRVIRTSWFCNMNRTHISISYRNNEHSWAY